MNPEGQMPFTLPPALVARLEEAAQAEGVSPSELVQELLERRERDRSWQELLGYGERRAKELGIAEEDVPRLVQESRQERRGR